MASGIYSITNVENGKMYIGSAVDLNKRKALHLSTLKNKTHHNYFLQKDFNDYGEKNFNFEII